MAREPYDSAPEASPTDPNAGPVTQPQDWAEAFFSSLGLPGDVANRVNQIFQQYPDVGQATQFALSYIRGTPWYSTTYPGITEGIKRGVIANEQDYRQYLNAANSIFRTYAGRDATGDDIASALTEGIGPDLIAKRFSGDTYASTYGNDLQYVSGAFGEGRLTDDELKAYGREQAGIDSPLGQQIQRRVQLAQERLKGAFSGRVTTGSLGLRAGRLYQPSLGTNDTPDVGK